MPNKKDAQQKKDDVHLDGAKESGNFKREAGSDMKIATSHKKRADANRLT